MLLVCTLGDDSANIVLAFFGNISGPVLEGGVKSSPSTAFCCQKYAQTWESVLRVEKWSLDYKDEKK